MVVFSIKYNPDNIPGIIMEWRSDCHTVNPVANSSDSGIYVRYSENHAAA